MSFLTLNGIGIDCSQPVGGQLAVSQIGDSKRAVDGTMRVHRRVVKNKWSFATTPQPAATADAIRDLILGKGEYWSFDDSVKFAYGSKGTGPSSITGGGVSYTASSPYLGAGSLLFGTNPSAIVFTALPLLANGPWTVFYALRVSGTWTHYIACSDGTHYVNGVSGAVVGLTVTPSAGTVLFNPASSGAQLDEVVILPFLIPSVSWAPQIYAYVNPSANAAQWSSLARVNAFGDMIEAGTKTVPVAGTITKSTYMVAALSNGTPAANVQSVAFDLDEV